MNRPLAVRFEGIRKSFGVPVLRDVSFELREGCVLGLIGENGAGKSTLMNILGGNLRPDSGNMELFGESYSPINPRAAIERGISFVHQELNLFPNLSVAENLFLTAFPRPRACPWIQRRRLKEMASSLLSEVGLKCRPETPVERLIPGERQMVEIARALAMNLRLLIFDEPTTSIGASEKEQLFALINRLRSRGISIIYISHTLSDVLSLSDDIVVLRDGAVVAQGPAAGFNIDRLVSLMVGRSRNQMYPQRNGNPGDGLFFEARGIRQAGIVQDISIRVCRGEIVGLYGLMGSGRSELARILFGLDPRSNGSIWLKGSEISNFTPSRRIRLGLALLTENRNEEGLCMGATIADNLALACLPQYACPPCYLVNDLELGAAIGRIRQKVQLSGAAGNEQGVNTLSGGNQQKVVLAKWLLTRPDMLILDEPTRGVDIGAKYEFYRLILRLADDGAGVLMISSDLEELLSICDRLAVMARGRIHAEFLRHQFDREHILRAAMPENQ